jgi:large subunit ribosomal protein L30
MSDKKTMKVKLVRSLHGRLAGHRACVRGLGLRRMHQVAEVEDTAATRGMLRKVSYMVTEVEEA